MATATWRFRALATLIVLALPLLSAASAAQPPSVEQALRLAPTQKDVDYDRPAAGEAAKCTITAEKVGGKTGWVIRDANGQVLRNFMDTNGDNVVDQWSYYKDGVEVYRDIDSNFNNKADQFRWLNTAGTRWGIDTNEDGKIDYWQVISPEEVTAEVVAALRDGDQARFNRLLLTSKELKTLGLGPAKTNEVAKKIDGAARAFKQLLGSQKLVTPKTNWVYFGGSRPAVVPAGTAESTSDLTVYENVAAMVETAGANNQLPIGTLVKVQDAWRLIDAPVVGENTAEVSLSPFFLPGGSAAKSDRPDQEQGRPNAEIQAMIAELEKIDSAPPGGSPEQQARQNARRAEILQQLAAKSDTPQLREQWLRQLADTVSAAVQSGAYPEGVEVLRKLHQEIKAKPDDADLAAYVEFRWMTANYYQQLQEPGSDKKYEQIQAQWLKDLERYVADNPKSADAPDAMLQLAIAQEFAGKDEDALKWYDQIVKNFGNSPASRKAKGAKLRLESVGNRIKIQGKKISGGTVDLAKYKGKVTLIHYWAAEYDVCRADLPQLKEMVSKFGKSGFAVIGVSLDGNQQVLETYLKENRLPWEQIYEGGGLDSRLGNEMGILTLPTMILVDQDGKVVNNNVQARELESELKSLLAPKGGSAAARPTKGAQPR